VPLVFRWPAGIASGRRTAQPAALLDVTPTVMALLGLEPPAVFQGESLEPWLHPGEAPPPTAREIYAVAYPGTVGHMPGFVRRIFARKRPDHPMQMALRQGGMKYVFSPKKGKARLYDLSADPGEKRNLLGERAEYRSFRVRLVEWFERTRKEEGATTLTAEDIRKLESLGYVGSARAASREEEAPPREEGPATSSPPGR
jgi:arylsulfatase A-like enzyme